MFLVKRNSDMHFLGQKNLQPKFHWVQKISNPIFLGVTKNSDPNLFGSILFWTQIFLGQQKNSNPNFWGKTKIPTQTFLGKSCLFKILWRWYTSQMPSQVRSLTDKRGVFPVTDLVRESQFRSLSLG